MEQKNKINITKIGNQENYNELDIEKSEVFLERLQCFVIDIGLVTLKDCTYDFEGHSYDLTTYYTLFFEDPKDGFEIKKSAISDFGDGETVRYFNKELELLVIFLNNKIKLIFYCDEKNREQIMSSLMKFGVILKPINEN